MTRSYIWSFFKWFITLYVWLYASELHDCPFERYLSKTFLFLIKWSDWYYFAFQWCETDFSSKDFRPHLRLRFLLADRQSTFSETRNQGLVQNIGLFPRTRSVQLIIWYHGMHARTRSWSEIITNPNMLCRLSGESLITLYYIHYSLIPTQAWAWSKNFAGFVRHFAV